MSNGVCDTCPHAVADHDATGCITCKCGVVFEAADPEPVAPEPEDDEAEDADDDSEDE